MDIQASYCNPVPPVVKDLPNGFVADCTPFLPEDLQLELPKKVIVRTEPEFKEVSYPYSKDVDMGLGIAYTEPFRILSESGVQKLRSIVNREAPCRAQSTSRTPSFLRGLGYLSTAVREYSESPILIDICSKLARQPLGVHPVSMNMGHVNISKIGENCVDSWHVDSVEFVLIVILSDMTDIVGGELQILNIPDASGNIFEDLKSNGVPEDLVHSISYIQPGHGIFMHGSKILHRVKGVIKGRDPRITMVTSFCSLDVFQPDCTRYATFLISDPEDVASLEFARHKAWRIEGKMKYIMEKCNFDTGPKHLSRVFAEAAEEMIRTSKILLREEDDTLHHFNSAPVAKKK